MRSNPFLSRGVGAHRCRSAGGKGVGATMRLGHATAGCSDAPQTRGGGNDVPDPSAGKRRGRGRGLGQRLGPVAREVLGQRGAEMSPGLGEGRARGWGNDATMRLGPAAGEGGGRWGCDSRTGAHRYPNPSPSSQGCPNSLPRHRTRIVAPTTSPPPTAGPRRIAAPNPFTPLAAGSGRVPSPSRGALLSWGRRIASPTHPLWWERGRDKRYALWPSDGGRCWGVAMCPALQGRKGIGGGGGELRGGRVCPAPRRREGLTDPAVRRREGSDAPRAAMRPGLTGVGMWPHR